MYFALRRTEKQRRTGRGRGRARDASPSAVAQELHIFRLGARLAHASTYVHRNVVADATMVLTRTVIVLETLWPTVRMRDA